MSNPYEDLEYLSEFLPEEGETIMITRRKGQLICEPFFEPMDRESSNAAGSINAEFIGLLLMFESRMKQIARIPVVICAVTWFWLCVALHQTFLLGWSDWYWHLGTLLMIGLGCVTYIRAQQRQYFKNTVCVNLQKQMLEHQLGKYPLITFLSSHRKFSQLTMAMTRWV